MKRTIMIFATFLLALSGCSDKKDDNDGFYKPPLAPETSVLAELSDAETSNQTLFECNFVKVIDNK